MNNLINGLVEQYRKLDRAENTLQVMLDAYKRMAKYMSFDEEDLKILDKKKAQQIVLDMSKDGYSNSTIKLSLVYVKELYNYAEIEHPFVKVKYPTVKRSSDDGHNFFTIEETMRIIEVAKGKGRKNDLRNSAMINLLVNNGVRKSEVLNLNREDLNFDELEITLWGTKKENKAIINVSQKTMDMISSYLDTREDDLSPVFLSSYKKRISTSGIDTIIAKIFEKANVKGSPHDLRATTASLMSEQGYGLVDIMTKLRHKSSVTTMGYIAQSKENKRKMADII